MNQHSADKLKALFPDFVKSKHYLDLNNSLPYAVVGDLLAYVRDQFTSNQLSVDDSKVRSMFTLINELHETLSGQEAEIVPAGFFESMLWGEDSDKYFIEAAKK